MNIRSLTLISTLLAQSVSAGTLVVEVGDGLKTGDQVIVTIYEGEDSWMKKPLTGMRTEAPESAAASGSHTLSIDSLPAGRYAVAVHVDRNRNGKLDRGMFGRPTEPYGFSNGGGKFGPPDYADAAFELPEAGAAIRVELN